jgi:hypothetical protein
MSYLGKYGQANNELSNLTFTSLLSNDSVSFLAFLSSFNQTFSSEWSTETVYGRNDPIATFRGTTRNLSLGFNVPGANAAESSKNMDNFSALAQMLYPEYGKSGSESVSTNALVITKPPLIRLKFANLISDSTQNSNKGLLGYITSLSFNPDLEMGMFVDSDKLHPKVFQLDIQFGVLHEHDLGTTPEGSFSNSAKFPFGG